MNLFNSLSEVFFPSASPVPTSDITNDIETTATSMAELKDLNAIIDDEEKTLKMNKEQVGILKRGCAELIRATDGVWTDGIERSNDDIIRLYKESESYRCDDESKLKRTVDVLDDFEKNVLVKEYHLQACKTKVSSATATATDTTTLASRIEALSPSSPSSHEMSNVI
mmetsp:Transcript_15778/g.32402  ORF Transcript_15778/g.32402 Transcript_15778/m.32402 type:complete len:168 (+) Transcript_15778:89-592(+)